MEEVTTFTENYLRLHLLEVKGGTLILRRLFLKIVENSFSKGDVDRYLDLFKDDIKLAKPPTSAEYQILFPSNGTTDINKWDISLLAYILIHCCTLDGQMSLKGKKTPKEILQKEVNSTIYKGDLDQFLRSESNKTIIDGMKLKNIITDKQYDCLYPLNNQKTAINAWDIELLILVLFNLCHGDNLQKIRDISKAVVTREVKLCCDASIDLNDFLRKHVQTFDDMRNHEKLTDSQHQQLFPSHGVPDLGNWDDTVLSLVVLNACQTLSPRTLKAVEKIRTLRKELGAHPQNTEIDNDTFRKTWTDLNLAINTIILTEVLEIEEEIGRAIDTIKNGPLDIEAAIITLKEHDANYISILSKFTAMESSFASINRSLECGFASLANMGRYIAANVTSGFASTDRTIRQSERNVTEKIDTLIQKNEELKGPPLMSGNTSAKTIMDADLPTTTPVTTPLKALAMAQSKMSVFEEPQCLINNDANNKLVIVQDVLDQLSTIKEQLNVVTIAGLYRTGKSYLLTRVAGKYKGFDLGSTDCSKTKGIWAWCVKHPVHADQMLLLLDTEGLGNVEKDDTNHNNQIFTLAMLLSSTLVYNMLGVFNQDALLKLTFITEMSNNIKTSKDTSGSSDDDDFDVFFPRFILALRDFSLLLIDADGRDVTPDQYLETFLSLKPGEGEETKRFNESKLFLRKYFTKRKCFTFDRPGNRKLLNNMDELEDDDLDEDFVKSTHMFMDYVHNKCEPLSLMNGKPVNGRMFASQVKYYVDAIREGAVPCIKSALESMVIIENEKAVKESIHTYIERMNAELSLPTPDEMTFQDVHIHCKKKAIDVFQNQSLMDKENKYKTEADIYLYATIKNKIDKEYSNFVKRNHEESRNRCNVALQDLSNVIEVKLRLGSYAVAGGYTIYKADREELKRKYDAKTNLGVEKQTMYVEFTNGIRNEEQSILFSDKMMTQKETEKRNGT